MSRTKQFLALDIGEKRIGVAKGDVGVRIAIPLETITVDGSEIDRIKYLIDIESIDVLVIGYPRNQSGDPTAQTAYVESIAAQLTGLAPQLVFQDESLTSVTAEQYLQASGRPYEKGDIDAKAAALILQDYLELLP
jgi:putative Holliday junction resolvase